MASEARSGMCRIARRPPQVSQCADLVAGGEERGDREAAHELGAAEDEHLSGASTHGAAYLSVPYN